MSYGILQINAYKYCKGHVFYRTGKEEFFDYPKLLNVIGEEYDEDQKSFDAAVKEITRKEAMNLWKEEKGFVSIYNFPKRSEFYLVEKDFIYIEPLYHCGVGEPGHASAIEFEMEQMGFEYSMSEYMEYLIKDVTPLLNDEEVKNKNAKKSWNDKSIENYDLLFAVSLPTVWKYSSHTDYFGEFDSWIEYQGILNMYKLSTTDEADSVKTKPCLVDFPI